MKQAKATPKTKAAASAAGRPESSGRRLRKLDIVAGIVAATLICFGIWSQLRGDPADSLTCKQPGTVHELTLQADTFSSNRLVINRCDTVRISNTGAERYELAFGEHDSHVSYPGFQMQPLGPGEYFIFDAVQAGAYTMHDHTRDRAKVNFDIRTLD